MIRFAMILAMAFAMTVVSCSKGDEDTENRTKSVRQERRAITAGNKMAEEGQLGDAISKYKEALLANPESAVGRYNLGLTQINLSKAMQDNDSVAKKLLESGVSMMQSVAQLGSQNPAVASKADFNLGNMAFDQEQYDQAIQMYKNALRLQPDYPEARRNLRIAQLKKRDQDENKDNRNQDQNQDQKEDQNQDKDQNQDQNQNEDQNEDQNRSRQQPPRENQISPQAAEQILNAVENNENQTRVRKGNNTGEKASGASSSMKKW